MAKYRSASLHVLGSEKASPDAVPQLPDLGGLALDADAPAEPSRETRPDADATAVGPEHHALARSRGRRNVAPAWLAGGVAALTLMGLVLWGSHDVLGARRGQAFPCPPATTSAVQAATGCAVPPPPAIDGEDEE